MSDNKCVPVNQNGYEICIGQKIEITRECEELIGSLEEGTIFTIQSIEETDTTPGVVVETEEDNEEKTLSPTSIGEGLGVVSYSDSPEQCLELLD